MNGLFITGTDTGVGKTYVTCRLARQLRAQGVRVGIYKPACSGAQRHPETGEWQWSDVEVLSAALAHEFPRALICPQTFVAPLAPPVAAQQEGRRVDPGLLRSGAEAWQELVDVLLVEGAGGWLSPVTDEETVADLASDVGFPVLVVAANRLGAINQTLLTVQSVHARKLAVAGVLLNNVSPDDDASREGNLHLLRRHLRDPIFGPLSFQAASELRDAQIFTSIAMQTLHGRPPRPPGDRDAPLPRN